MLLQIYMILKELKWEEYLHLVAKCAIQKMEVDVK
jgi:hypothetical protein